MEYDATEISPVKQRINVAVPAAEVDAALTAACALYKNSVQLDGFRRGKAPLSVIEKKFHDQIYSEAKDDLVGKHLSEIMGSIDVKPLPGLRVSADEVEFERGKDFKYAIEFETLPKIELPNYLGLEVEEEKSDPDPKVIERIIERVRGENAVLLPVDGSGPATDGQIAVIDFEGLENGEPVKDVKALNFGLELGRGNALSEFEDLVKGIPVGHTAEGEITFPSDFIDQNIAGKTLTMKVRVHAVKERKLPEFNDDLAKKLGYESAEKFREALEKGYRQSLKELRKSAAEGKLLEQILKQTEFALPEGLVETTTTILLGDLGARLEKQGVSIHALKKSVDELRQEFRPRAEELTRSQVLLMSIADKENIEITDEEVIKNIYQNCARSGEDFNQAYKSLRESGMIHHMKDKMLADKAMDFIYSKANITYVDPKPEEGDATGAEETDINEE